MSYNLSSGAKIDLECGSAKNFEVVGRLDKEKPGLAGRLDSE
jgi:hypothetical protein